MKSFMEWEPVSTSASISHRVEVKEAKTTKLLQRENYKKSEDEKSLRTGSNRKQRFKCLKCDSTEHSVRNCPSCAPGEADSLLKYRRSESERKVKKAVASCSSEEGMTTVDGIENVNTLLDSESDCRMISAGLV